MPLIHQFQHAHLSIITTDKKNKKTDMPIFDELSFDELSFDELYQAWLKARKKKKPSINQLTFENQLFDNLIDLQQQLINQTWQPKPYTCFIATKPKIREIHAPDFGDRVVHHWLAPQIERIFEPKFIYDSYANRHNKGTHKAVKRLQKFIRQVYDGTSQHHHNIDKQKQHGYYLQADIANFFNSIHRPTLWRLIHPHVWQRPASTHHVIYTLLQHSINDMSVKYRANHRQRQNIPSHKRLSNAKPDCGLPIGNLTSQLFANIYLNQLDQYIKHQLKIKHYVRYVDDFVIIHQDKQQLHTWLKQIEQYLLTHLKLKLKRTPKINPLRHGIDFLGYVIYPRHTQVRRRVIANLRHKIHHIPPKYFHTKPCKCHYFAVPSIRYSLKVDVPTYQKFRATYTSYLGHIKHAKHQHLLKKLYKDYPWLQGFHIKHIFLTQNWFVIKPRWLWTQLIFSQPQQPQENRHEHDQNTIQTQLIIHSATPAENKPTDTISNKPSAPTSSPAWQPQQLCLPFDDQDEHGSHSTSK